MARSGQRAARPGLGPCPSGLQGTFPRRWPPTAFGAALRFQPAAGTWPCRLPAFCHLHGLIISTSPGEAPADPGHQALPQRVCRARWWRGWVHRGRDQAGAGLSCDTTAPPPGGSRRLCTVSLCPRAGPVSAAALPGQVHRAALGPGEGEAPQTAPQGERPWAWPRGPGELEGDSQRWSQGVTWPICSARSALGSPLRSVCAGGTGLDNPSRVRFPWDRGPTE